MVNSKFIKSVLVVLMLTIGVNTSIANDILSGKDKKETRSKQAKAADDVELISSSDGKTKDEAIKNALRAAIEQTYGTFVSSKTQILNDEIVRDEIITVSSGNVKEYEIIDEQSKTNGYFVTLRAVVSVGKLIKYTQSKGGETELAGATFAMNVKLRQLQLRNEQKVLDNMLTQLSEMAPNMFDYSIRASEPKDKGNNQYEVILTVSAVGNKTAEAMWNLFYGTIKSLAVAHVTDARPGVMGKVDFIRDEEEYKKIRKNGYGGAISLCNYKYDGNAFKPFYEYYYLRVDNNVVNRALSIINESAKNFKIKSNFEPIVNAVSYKSNDDSRWHQELTQCRALNDLNREYDDSQRKRSRFNDNIFMNGNKGFKQYQKKRKELMEYYQKMADDGYQKCQEVSGGRLWPNKVGSYLTFTFSKPYSLDEIEKLSKFSVEKK